MTGKESLTVILLPASTGTVCQYLRSNPGCKHYSWLFLAKDASISKELHDTLSPEITFINSSEMLQEIALSHRQVFVDYIGNLSAQHHSLHWWLTSVSEKNPFISLVFLNFCYLKIIENALSANRNLVIICGSTSLMNAIQDTFGQRHGIKVTCNLSWVDRIAGSCKRRLTGAMRKVFFVIRWTIRVALAALYRFTRNNREDGSFQKITALHSWTDSRSFTADNTWRDSYFGTLGSHLNASEPGFFRISDVLPTLYYPRAIGNISRCSDRIELFESYLSALDPFRALLSILIQFPSIRDIPLLCNINISSLIQDEISFDQYESVRSETSLLYYYAGKRMAQQGVKTIIYTFENHMWEKMLASGVRTTGTDCRLVGYAHSVVSPMYLFYSLSAAEREIAPVPDLILVNGRRSKVRLTNAGFDTTTMKICGAFRYANVSQLRNIPRDARKGNVILVITTSGFDETIELVNKVLSAFGTETEIPIIIKPHPTLPTGTITSVFSHLPSHFTLSFEPVEKLLERADLVLFTESAVSIEALAYHIPILHIRSDLRVDMNLFEGMDAVKSASEPNEIRRLSFSLLREGGIPANECDAIVDEFFGQMVENPGNLLHLS